METQKLIDPANEKEKMIFVTCKSFYQGARANHAEVRRTEHTIQIIAWLNGHKILDSGELSKNEEPDIIVRDIMEDENGKKFNPKN